MVMLDGKAGASTTSARNGHTTESSNGHASPETTEQLPDTTFSEEEINPEEIPF